MGVSNAFQYLEERYKPQEVGPEHLVDQIHVDLHSLFIGYCSNTLSSIKARNWKKPPARQKPLNDLVKDFALVLVKKFPSFLTKQNCTLHLDGAHTLEKEPAHAKRLKKFQDGHGDHVRDSNSHIEKVSDQLSLVTSASPLSPQQRRRILRSASKAISSYQKIRTFSLDQTTTTAQASALRELGWSAHCCTGESDHCISVSGAATVVTADSDYLFRGARLLLRKDPMVHSKYTAYVIKDILEALGVTSAAWSVVGVVSGNDFSDNIHGRGMARNVDCVKHLTTAPTPSDEATTILQRYCNHWANDEEEFAQLQAKFHTAAAVFLHNRETILADASTQNRRDVCDLECRLKEVLGHVSTTLKSYQPPAKTPSDAVQMNHESGFQLEHVVQHQYAARRVSTGGYDTAGRRLRYRERTHHMHQAKDVALSPDPPPAKRRRITKKTAAKPLHDRATRQSRLSEEHKDRAIGAPRRLNVSTLIDHYMSGSHFQQVALTIGTAGQCLKKTLGQDSTLAREVKYTLCELTRLGTNLTRAVYQALFLFVSATFVAFPSMSEFDCARRKAIFKPVAYADSYRSLFWFLSKLIRGDSKTDHDAAGASMYRLMDETLDAGSNERLAKVLGIDSPIQSCLHYFIIAIALHAQDVFQQHMCGHVSELKTRIAASSSSFP